MVSAPFLKKFESFDAARRARIILGMDRLRRKYQEANGGVDHVFHDISEYLLDRETIDAYLAEVKALGDRELMRVAYADTERARARIEASDHPKTAPKPTRRANRSPFPTYLRPSPEKDQIGKTMTMGNNAPPATRKGDAPLRRSSIE